MSKETEQDVYIEVAGYQVYCLAKFEFGLLYSITAYEIQSWDGEDDNQNDSMKIGNLMPFLHPDVIDEIEQNHKDALSETE